MAILMDVQVEKSAIDGAGRGLFATRDFAPGDIIVQLDRPYVAELDITRLRDTCAWCFRRGATTSTDPEAAGRSTTETSSGFFAGVDVVTKACTGCKRVRYCSKTCQSRAWKREHKYECKVLAPEGRPDLPHGVRAVIKLLGRLKNDPKNEDELLVDILQFLPAGGGGAELEQIKRDNPQRVEDFSMLAYGAWKYAGEPKLGDMDSETIAKAFFFNVMSNTMQLSNPLDDISLGVGFDPIICSANHSCDPNAVAIFNQPKQLLRASKPIKKGDEIFMKYVDVSNPFSVRQAQLRESYFFRCRCSKCVKGAVFAEDKFLKPPEELRPEYVKIADGLISRHERQLPMFFVPANDEAAQRRVAAIQAEAFSVSGITFDFNQGNENASEEEVLDALRLCLNSGLWSYSRQPVPHLIRQLLTLHLAQGRVYQAWRLGLLRHFLIAPSLYSRPYIPDRVIDCWLMATATNSLCNPTNPNHKEIFASCMKAGLDLRVVYFGFLTETREQIDQSYGKDSPFGRVVESVYQQTVQNMDIGVEEIEERVKESWPKLEAVANNVDVLKLS
ncbi:SET domain and MYND-type zinc finger 6 [Lecanosticta acicola]|uniref:SET domain and MYND-type zinc finger 6 n=1 Tax=Lecanosticta acicola TaxID=111012 RepID=A0AAI8YVA7_9PEZI|nr:SET domain and MYND-type zinc finger 6 [Lecanosticta acicola]